jgi:predicted type IV restriction endonuclease
MSSTPPRIAELVETFDRNIETYHSQQYNETQLRREFIDPFFEGLGWDVPNKLGYAQAYKEVIHEDAIKVGTATKAPDYSFRIGGVRKFFLEAKKPSINIGGDPHPAYQLRRYAWSAKLPLSILTDFEEFVVYDCQMRPKQTDGTSTARIMFLTCKDYIDKWNEIADIFSKEAVLKGSFDKFAVSAKAKRGTTTVDKEFLAELEKWRAEFARIIALRNIALSAHEINFAVQRTIDRIIFLRMCEDRGIEPYGQLQTISNGSRTYPRLCEIFEKADHKYNSGLFYFQKERGRPENPDEMTLNLVIDDAPLKYILHSLYYPLCPYEFSVLPPEILGNVYEQFLGSVIRVSSGRRTKVEPKPEVKKAGGIYYTPDYIVDYIVKNTVGRLLGVLPCHSRESGNPQPRHSERSEESQLYNSKSKIVNRESLTPKQVANLRILAWCIYLSIKLHPRLVC